MQSFEAFEEYKAQSESKQGSPQHEKAKIIDVYEIADPKDIFIKYNEK